MRKSRRLVYSDRMATRTKRTAVKQTDQSGTKRSDTRERLIRAGTELMTEQGFGVTGMDLVLKRVGVPKGSFYHYFDSKLAFGEAVIENYASFFAGKLDRLFGDELLSPMDRIRGFVAEARAGMERYQFLRGCLIGNLGQELGSMNDAFRHQLEGVLQSWQWRIARCLREAVQAGQLDMQTDVQALAEFFWIGWEGAILRAKLQRSAEPLDRFANIFFEKVALAPVVTSTRVLTSTSPNQ